MAEGESRESQTEEPTEKKIGDALERGDAPIAREASLFASVSAMLIIGAFAANGVIAAMTAAAPSVARRRGRRIDSQWK